jgi:ATP-dependent HslUV protease subunit HslV
MTTVAYRDGVMAADSSCWEGSTNAHSVRKVWKIRKCLIGCSGNMSDIHAFVRWIKDGAIEEEYPRMKQLAAIVATSDGKVCSFESGSFHPIPVVGKYCSVGSGADVALGAMHHGATAVEAIRAARHHNEATKGRIITVKYTTG